MSDATTRKLLEILSQGKDFELRRASALIIGEIRPKGRPTIQALGNLLKDSNPQLRRAGIDALGKLGGEDSLSHLLILVRQGGDEAELAALAAAKIGSAGVKILLKEMEGAAPSVKKAIAAAMARSGAQHAVDTALQSLLDENPEVVDAARRSLESEADRVDEPGRKNLAKRLVSFLSKKEVFARPTAVGASLRILEKLHDPAAEKMLWKWVNSSYPGPIRAAALRALVHLPPPKEKSILKTLMRLLDEKDPGLVRPSLEILGKLTIPASFVGKLLQLLDSPEPFVRVFSLRALRGVDNAKVAEAVMVRLHHPDPEMRRAAEEIASLMPSARKILARQLLASKDVAQSWALVRILRRESGGIDSSTVNALMTRAMMAVEKDEPYSEPLLHFVRKLEPKKSFDLLRKRGMQLRKAKKFAEAVRCLRLLTKEPEFTATERFELALAGLMLSPRRVDQDSRAADPSLTHFLTLAHMDSFRLLDKLKKERIVGAEEYFYLGYHFIERGDQKKSGIDFLKYSLKKWPKSKVAKEAKIKLAAAS